MLGYTWYFGTRGTREGTNKNIKKIETKETQGFILFAFTRNPSAERRRGS